jgi:hypothetical protein
MFNILYIHREIPVNAIGSVLVLPHPIHPVPGWPHLQVQLQASVLARSAFHRWRAIFACFMGYFLYI